MTAVEWLANELYEKFEMRGDGILFNEILEKAKEMEKQQMKDAVLAQCTTHEGLRKIFDKQFEQYFTETFKTK